MTAQEPPSKVVLASRLMWLLWAAGALYLIIALVSAIRMSLPGTSVLASMYALVIVLLALLIRAVTRGRNWARMTYAAIAGLGIVLIALGWVRNPAADPIRAAVSVFVVFSYVVVLRLLFHPSVSSWFRRTVGAT